MIITIAGADKAILLNSLTVDDTLNSRNTCSFSLVDKTGLYRPVVGNEVIITEGVVIFAGTIDGITEQILPGTTTLQYSIECVDYNQLCDRYTVPQAYDSKTLGYIVKDIINNYMPGEGITYTNVEDGPTITKAVFVYSTVTEAFDDLSDLTGYDWYIDYDKDLHFFARESNSAPAEISTANNNFISINISRTRDQYRNRQYLRAGNDITSSRSESFKGDGENQTFTLKYPVALVPSAVSINAVAKTIGIRGVETGKNFYWSKNEKEITQDDAGTALTSSETLNITYQGFYPIIIRSDLGDAIADRQTVEGGAGIYEHIEEDQSIESQDAAKEKAQGLLRRYGTIPETLSIITDTAGFRAGQLLTVDIPIHAINGTYLIQSVKTNDVGAGHLRYGITALSGENIGGWVQFFKKLAMSGKKYVIRENEVLIRISQSSDSITLSDSMVVTSAAPESRVEFALVDFSEVGT